MAKALHHPWEKLYSLTRIYTRPFTFSYSFAHVACPHHGGACAKAKAKAKRGKKGLVAENELSPLSYLIDYYSHFLSVTFSVKLVGHFQGSPLLLSLWCHDTSTHSSARATTLDFAHLHLYPRHQSSNCLVVRNQLNIHLLNEREEHMWIWK